MVTADNRLARRIDVDVASHHHIVDPILPQLRTALAGLTPQTAQIPMYSTVDGVDGDPRCDAQYWVANLRHPVRFTQAVSRRQRHPHHLHRNQPTPLADLRDQRHPDRHPSSRAGHPDPRHPRHRHLPHRAQHHPHHHPPTTEHPPEPHPQLPTTPWHHTRHWITTAVTAAGDMHHPDRWPVPTGRRRVAPSAVADDGGGLRDWWYVPRWVPRAATTAHGAPGGHWLVFADTEVGVELGRTLMARYGCIRRRSSMMIWTRSVVTELDGAQQVLFTPAVTGAAIDVAEAYRLFHAVKKLTAALVSECRISTAVHRDTQCPAGRRR